MADPTTVNVALIVPNTGADVDTWGAVALNPDFVALDGFIGGVQTIGVTNAPVMLTAPAGAITPSPGPTQAQNRVLRFTGVMTADVRITLPLPGAYLIDNRTTGAFVLTFQGVTATEVIAVDQGNIVEIYNDGANVRYVNLGKVGALEFWGGISAMPAWVGECTVAPYLLCDGTVYNYSQFPYLGPKYAAQFGGNGATTFGVQDLSGRYPLAYDKTGARITVANSGINGQTMGAAGGSPDPTIAANNVPNGVGVSVSGTVTVSVGSGNVPTASVWNNRVTTASGADPYPSPGSGVGNASSFSGPNTLTGATVGNPAPTPLITIPPVQVAGIWVVKT